MVSEKGGARNRVELAEGGVVGRLRYGLPALPIRGASCSLRTRLMGPEPRRLDSADCPPAHIGGVSRRACAEKTASVGFFQSRLRLLSIVNDKSIFFFARLFPSSGNETQGALNPPHPKRPPRKANEARARRRGD